MTPRRDGQRWVVGVLGSGDMANRCEPLLNVVISNKPKTLTGLNQTVWGRVCGLQFPVAQLLTPPADRRSLRHPRGRTHGTW